MMYSMPDAVLGNGMTILTIFHQDDHLVDGSNVREG